MYIGALTIVVPQAIDAQTDNSLVEKQLVFQGLTRTYYVHTPTSYNGGAVPLVFCLHGGDGSAVNVSQWTHMSDTADRYGFMVVYPQGIAKQWQDGRTHPGHRYIDDVGFFNALIDQLSKDYAIDQRRIYAIGISNGGFMVQRLACQLSNRISAVCSIAASRLENMPYSPAGPIPIMFVLGTADPFIPWNGGEITASPEAPGVVYSAYETICFWTGVDQTVPIALAPVLFDETYADETRVTIKVVSSSDNESVESVTVYGGGHCWPGEPSPLPASIVGKTSPFDTNTYAWAFFQRHPRQ
jgi:polyhydroxybutyrate depolymerase